MKMLPAMEDSIIDAVIRASEKMNVPQEESEFDEFINIMFTELGFPKDPSYYENNER